MCGIVGIYSFKKNSKDQKPYIQWCLETMKHRGPDSNGIWQSENYIAGFVRLAIRDVSDSGNQPMVSACGNYCLTFNGEIYNAENYKSQLEQKGVIFKSSSDTEILLYALIHFGLDFVLNEFDGMFAFAFFNCVTKALIVARDRLGIKPLYIGFNGKEEIIFSSQYDHIINYEKLQQEPLDATVVASYLQLGFVADGLGIVTNTLLLPHGHYLKATQNTYEIIQYYSVLRKEEHGATNLVESDIQEAVKSQLISDVPLGTFMSGGVDSSLITLLANKCKPTTAYTISTSDADTDESEKAKWFAEKFNLSQVIKNISEKEIHEVINEHVKAYSEPFADFSSLPSLLISKVARNDVKVILSGDGPDELFWGYSRNSKMLRVIKRFQKPKIVNLGHYFLSKFLITPKILSKRFFKSKLFADYYYQSLFIYGSEIWLDKICKYKPVEAFFAHLIKQKTDVINPSVHNSMNTIWNYEMNIHLQRILLKMDRASMYHSLESRVPYLSNEIIDKASKISWQKCLVNNNGKDNIKKLLAKFTGNDFVYSKKKGFDIPMNKWINSSLKKSIEQTFNTMPVELEDILNKEQLKKMLTFHFTNQEQNGNLIWAIYSLTSWYNYHRNSYKNYMK